MAKENNADHDEDNDHDTVKSYSEKYNHSSQVVYACLQWIYLEQTGFVPTGSFNQNIGISLTGGMKHIGENQVHLAITFGLLMCFIFVSEYVYTV